MRLAEALDNSLEHTTDRNYKSTKSNSNSIVKHIGSDVSIDKFSELHIVKLVAGLKEEGNSDATVNRKLSTLRKALRLVNRKLEVLNDFCEYRTTEKPCKFRVMSEEEEEDLLAVLDIAGEKELRDLVIVLLDTGMRFSEALRICEEDVDDSLILVWKSKNDLARSVPMTKRVVDIISSRPNFNISYYEAEYKFRKYRDMLNISNDLTLHSLRHTCASRLVRAGVDLYIVQRWLGHKDIKTTQRYAHLHPKQLIEAVNVLEK